MTEENKLPQETVEAAADQAVKAQGAPETLTEVTSVAQEELKNNVQVQTPSAEELVHRASSSLSAGLQELERVFRSDKISRRGMARAMIAILDLPSQGIPVRLKKGMEQYAFAVGQRVVRDRFIITQYHVAQEQKIYKQLLDLKKVQDEVIEKMKSEGKPEDEIKAMQEKHKDSMITLEKVLRGEDEDVEIPLAEEENNSEPKQEGETNE